MYDKLISTFNKYDKWICFLKCNEVALQKYNEYEPVGTFENGFYVDLVSFSFKDLAGKTLTDTKTKKFY